MRVFVFRYPAGFLCYYMNPWAFFETILVINLPHRTDRLNQARTEFSRNNLYITGVIEGVVNTPGCINDGFNKAQRNALEACKGPSLILEDDVIFSDISHLPQALIDLPTDWDLCYLGANVIGTDLCSWPEPEYYTNNLRRVKQAWTTHAIAYSEKGLEWILKNWNYQDGTMYDDFLRQNLEKLQAFIVYPMVADQRPGYSDIWTRDVNYGFFNVWNQKK
jgi:hypothetical protein